MANKILKGYFTQMNFSEQKNFSLKQRVLGINEKINASSIEEPGNSYVPKNNFAKKYTNQGCVDEAYANGLGDIYSEQEIRQGCNSRPIKG